MAAVVTFVFTIPANSRLLANGDLETRWRSLALRQKWPPQLGVDSRTELRHPPYKAGDRTVVSGHGSYRAVVDQRRSRLSTANVGVALSAAIYYRDTFPVK